LLAGSACFGVLWLTFPCRPRAELHLPGLSGRYGSRDGRTITTVVPITSATAERQPVVIWDLATGRERARFEIPWIRRDLPDRSEINDRVDFYQSRGGRFFVLADLDQNKVTLWHADTGVIHAIWPGSQALTSDDDRILAMAAADSRAV